MSVVQNKDRKDRPAETIKKYQRKQVIETGRVQRQWPFRYPAHLISDSDSDSE